MPNKDASNVEENEELAKDIFAKFKPLPNRMFEKSESLGRKDEEDELRK